MQGPCKKEKTQHDIHNRLVEIDPRHKLVRAFPHGIPAKKQEQNTQNQTNQENPNAGGKLEKTVINVAKDSSEGQQDRSGIENIHIRSPVKLNEDGKKLRPSTCPRNHASSCSKTALADKPSISNPIVSPDPWTSNQP
ncbi:hypothetical protein N9288_01160 [bacterium]|nr:hypothetical protein [bacterium]